MRSFLHKLEVKFVFLATVAIILGATVINYLIYNYERNEHYGLAKSRSELLSSFTLNVIVDHLNSSLNLGNKEIEKSLTNLLKQISRDQQGYIVNLTVYNSNLVPVFSYPNTNYNSISLQRVRLTLERDMDIIQEAYYDNRKAIESYKPIHVEGRNIGVLRLIMSSEKEQVGLGELMTYLGTVTIVVCLVAILIAIVVARTLAKPIKVLSREMELVEVSHYKTSLKKDRKDELGNLQERFLVMLDRLRKSEQEKEKTRNSLIQVEKMASIGTLASGIAHEINNPLAGLKQSINRIMADPENVAQTKKYISMINKALLHIEKVVKGLLDFSRERELSLRHLNINMVLEDSIKMLEYQIDKNNINIVKELGKDLQSILGDVYYLEQVFINILLNAIDAMPDGGELIIRSYLFNANSVIEIEDTGLGMPENQLDRVFDPFFTTKEEGKGTGLGLSICYSIIKEHGGKITIESEVGVGTKVAIALPYA